MQGQGYRDDIDWLRAIAVLAVVAFHFEVPGIWGGYVGVDIFFVISGYLITGIIQAEVREGTFSFARFYERRVRRLLPALYAMVALTAIPSFHYLLTSERAEFFRSISAVVTFTSNIFFWLQSGYFDHAAVEKPLLHTWSLAVEEQFYLALPVLFWVLSRMRRERDMVPWALAILTFASLALSVWLMRSDRWATAFYMSPPRAWEFLIGSLVAMPGLPKLPSFSTRFAARIVSIILLAAAIFGLRKESSFPGLNALPPCIGAAIFIWSDIRTDELGRYLRPPVRVLAFFGKISYSLYLWHWPLFTFARFSKPGLVLDPLDKLALFSLTVGLSYLSWRYVELPFRNRPLAAERRGAFRLAATSSLALVVASWFGIAVSQTSTDGDHVAAHFESYDQINYKALYGYGKCFGPESGAFDETCLGLAKDKLNVLLWGDSFAAHYVPGLREALSPGLTHVLQATQPACMPTLSEQTPAVCRRFADQMRLFFRDHRPDLVLISGDWLEYARAPKFNGMVEDLKSTIAQLGARGIRVVLLGPAMQFKSRLPSMLARAHLRGVEARSEDMLLPDVFDLDRTLRSALPSMDTFSYVSVLDAVCPNKQCSLTAGENAPVSFDHAHLTAEGSRYVAAKLMPKLPLYTSSSAHAVVDSAD
jgi:peptidoglycan/LPS O-acetylase OafA/YrhL